MQPSVSRRMRVALVALAGLTLYACENSSAPIVPEHHGASHSRSGEPTANINKQLAELRRATAPFHNFEKAQAAGYTILFDPDGEGPGSACLSHPTEGAMGEHYVDPALLFDGGALDVARPEALIYEPQRNGKYRLVAVEYVVPFSDVPKTADPPVLLGQEFMANDNPGFHLWALHVWVWEHNPSGMFKAWNPRVTCEFSKN